MTYYIVQNVNYRSTNKLYMGRTVRVQKSNSSRKTSKSSQDISSNSSKNFEPERTRTHRNITGTCDN